MKEISLKISSLGETSELAGEIASKVKGGEVICLIGELGVGKTYFVKFFAEALGIDMKQVISPTFVYWRRHEGKEYRLNHFDFYRISDDKEVDDVGLEEAFNEEQSVTIIEWADKIKNRLPEDRLEIHIVYLGETERSIKFVAYGKESESLIGDIKEN